MKKLLPLTLRKELTEKKTDGKGNEKEYVERKWELCTVSVGNSSGGGSGSVGVSWRWRWRRKGKEREREGKKALWSTTTTTTTTIIIIITITTTITGLVDVCVNGITAYTFFIYRYVYYPYLKDQSTFVHLTLFYSLLVHLEKDKRNGTIFHMATNVRGSDGVFFFLSGDSFV